MFFPTKLGKRHIIYVPTHVCERLGLKEGDDIDIDIQPALKIDKEYVGWKKKELK